MDFKLGKSRGQIAGQLTGTVLAVIIVAVLLVVGAVIFGQLATINTSSFGAATNTTKMINATFDLMFTTEGVVVLVIVVALLALVIYSVMSGLGGGRGR